MALNSTFANDSGNIDWPVVTDPETALAFLRNARLPDDEYSESDASVEDESEIGPKYQYYEHSGGLPSRFWNQYFDQATNSSLGMPAVGISGTSSLGESIASPGLGLQCGGYGGTAMNASFGKPSFGQTMVPESGMSPEMSSIGGAIASPGQGLECSGGSAMDSLFGKPSFGQPMMPAAGLPLEVPIIFPYKGLKRSATDSSKERNKKVRRTGKPKTVEQSITAIAKAPRVSKSQSVSRISQMYEGREAALVVGTQISEFAGNVPRDTCDDLLNAFLFAQLHAEEKTKQSNGDSREFYENYKSSLANMGLVMLGNGEAITTLLEREVAVHEAIIPVIAAALGPEVAAVALIIEILRELSSMDTESRWIELFHRHADQRGANRFQISRIWNDKRGITNILLQGYELEASQYVTKILFFKHSRPIKYKLDAFSVQLSLNRHVFDGVKDFIREHVESRAKRFVESIARPLKPN